MDWSIYLKDTTDDITSFRQVQPDTGKAFTAMHHASMDDGALDKKTKELLALSIGISQRCIDCIGFHVKGAIKQGATREEISETISVAVMMGGGPSYMYGVKALDAFDQLS